MDWKIFEYDLGISDQMVRGDLSGMCRQGWNFSGTTFQDCRHCLAEHLLNNEEAASEQWVMRTTALARKALLKCAAPSSAILAKKVDLEARSR